MDRVKKQARKPFLELNTLNIELEKLKQENASLKEELATQQKLRIKNVGQIEDDWLTLVQSAARVGYWESYGTDMPLTWSPGMYSLYGIEPSDKNISYQDWESRIHPEDLDRASSPDLLTDLTSSLYDTEFRIIWPDQSVHWILARAKLVRDENKQVVKFTGINVDITEQKQAEERARKAETLFRTLFDSIPDAVLATDDEGHYIDVNSTAIEMLGYSREEFLKMRSVDLVDASPEISEEILQEFATKGYWQAEMKLKRKDGQAILTDGRATLVDLPDNGGKIGVAVVRDITQKRRAEEELFKGQQLFQHIIDFSDANIFVKDIDFRFLLVNRRVEEIFGLERKDIVGKTDSELFPDSTQEMQAQWRTNDLAVLSSQNPLHLEEEVIQADEKRIVLSTKFPLRDSNGEIYAIGGIATDITERKLAEKKLHQREQEFRALAENSPDIITRFDQQHRQIYVNPVVERLNGISLEQVNGKTLQEITIPLEIAAAWEEKLAMVFQTGQETSIEYSWPYLNVLEMHHFQARFAPEFAPDGSVQSVLAVSRDITEQKRLEERLRFLSEVSIVLASSLDYEITLQKVTSMAVPYLADYCLFDIVNEDGRSFKRVALTHRDPAKVAIAREINYKFPPDPENHPLAIVLATGQPLLIRNLEETVSAQAHNQEHLTLLQELDPKSAVYVPLRLQNRVIGVLTFITAESGRRFEQTDLELAEELARRSTVAIENARLYRESQQALQTRQELNDLKDFFMAVVGHELRTPLTSIKGYAQMLQRNLNRLALEEKGRLLGSTETIIQQADRLNDMVKQLFDFSRIQNLQFAVNIDPLQDLNGLVNRIVEQHRHANLSHKFLVELPTQPIQAALDTARIEQVLDNLINNAVKYSEPGTNVRIGLQANPGEVIIWVQDEGRGISLEDQARIFNRFYRILNTSTNKVDGLGLGLYISSQIVQQHGGRIWIKSEPGQGSTFFFSIPQQ